MLAVTTAQVPPREYVFVVDVSGSMHGFPLDTAQELLRNLIGGLRPDDTFNVLFFSGGSNLWAPRSLPATDANVESALRMLGGRRGGGGTRLLAAMQRALALPVDDGARCDAPAGRDEAERTHDGVFAHLRVRPQPCAPLERRAVSDPHRPDHQLPVVELAHPQLHVAA